MDYFVKNLSVIKATAIALSPTTLDTQAMTTAACGGGTPTLVPQSPSNTTKIR
jgi:hypothetical protein